jgi:hypothetical protein
VVGGLKLDPAQWETMINRVERRARGPEGEDVTLVDNVILLSRAAGAGQ